VVGEEVASAEGETVLPEGEQTAPEGEGTEVSAEGEQAGDTETSDGETADSVAEEEEPAGEKEPERVVVGYRNVKMFRSDFQAVCDSLVSFSVDSTIHLHIKPILWNEENQVTSDLTVVHTKNEQLERAVFTGGEDGNPIMAAQLDTAHYNQITGREITAFFADNELYRVDAKGNGLTYYYMQDEDTGDIQDFTTVESADITFHIKERQMETIVWRVTPVFNIYPMDMIPETQEQRMPNFEWQGHLRPAKSDVFDRVIRSTEREFYSALSKPQFPLTDKIHTYRKELIRGGLWHDRTEDISPLARDFIFDIESGRIVM
jgi:hypothetical protein